MDTTPTAAMPLVLIGFMILAILSFRKAWARTVFGWALIVFGASGLMLFATVAWQNLEKGGEPSTWFSAALAAAFGVCLILGGMRARRWAREPIGPQSYVAGVAPTPATVVFRNPANGYEERFDRPMLWTFLFGPVYFAYKGAWMAALTNVLFVAIALPIAWMIVPFFAEKMIRKHYMHAGWVEVSAPVGNPIAA